MAVVIERLTRAPPARRGATLVNCEETQSLIIKRFDDDSRSAIVLTPLVSLGEIIPWFPAVYNHFTQRAQKYNRRIVIVVPAMFECLVERFSCSRRIVIKGDYHLSMLAHRRRRFNEARWRWPEPDDWEQKAQVLISELRPCLENIVWEDTVGVFCTDVHTYSPALPVRCNHWTLDQYARVDASDPKNWITFTPPQQVLDSFPYDWNQHPRPFVAMRTHAGVIDAQRIWHYWNDFLEIMESRFEGTVFRLGGLDDMRVKLTPRRNFVDLGNSYDTVAPLVCQMAHMDYYVSTAGAMGWLALALKIPTLMFVDEYCRSLYGTPNYDYTKGWGTDRVERFYGNTFNNFTAEEVFGKFQRFR